MDSKLRLLHIPVALAAFGALFRLSGLPGGLHLTPARLLFMGLVLCGFLFWVALFREFRQKRSGKNPQPVLFPIALISALFSALLIFAGNRLGSAEGFLYKAGSFIRQAAPFLMFFGVLCLCTAVLCFLTVRPRRDLSLGIGPVLSVLLILLVSILLFAAYFPLRTNYYPSHDYSIFAYIGQQILRGKMPYTELWDHKPPVIFYLNALGLKLAGGSLLGIWLLEFAAFFLGNLIFFRVLKRRFSAGISLSVLFFGMLHYVRVFDFGNYTEEVSLFFALCSLGLFFGGDPDRRPVLKGALCGILCGLAFTCKQNTIGCWAALFLTDLIQVLPLHENRDLFRKYRNFWLTAGAGFLLVNAAWVVYFACNHALEAYWDVAFWFNWIYSEKSGESRLACALTTLTFLPSLTPYLLLGFLSWIPASVHCFRQGIRDFVREHPLTAWAVIALPVELVLVGLSGMNYQHYFILCIPPVIVLLCAPLSRLFDRIESRKALFRAAMILILCAGSLPLFKFYRENYEPRSPSAYTKTRDHLLAETDPDQPILVWGSRSAIYVMSERYAPTAYFNERPLYLFPGDVRASQWEELLRDLQTDPPQAVVYTHDSALPFIENDASGCKIPDGADYTIPVYQFFCENYEYDLTINEGFRDAWEVYRRK